MKIIRIEKDEYFPINKYEYFKVEVEISYDRN